MRERFLRETRTAGAMSHPNVVPIHGADEIDGHVFFVMAFVDGDSLAAQIRGMGRLEPRSPRASCATSRPRSLRARRGIIHRDIKAENILIDREIERALVTDFGIARVVEAQPITATGQLLGTVDYVSPEQVAGDRIDSRSDLYSLGVVGFLALTGRFPFDDELASAVLVAHVNRPAPPVRSIAPAVPAALAAIVDRCLAKDPAARYPSASALLAALDAAIADPQRAMTAHQSDSPSRALRVSDTEARAVWDRASLLQAATDSRPLPPADVIVRDAELDRARMSGHRVNDVRDAGREAGISTQFMDRALAERGLAESAASRGDVPARPVPRRSWWAGAPVEAVEGAIVPGELSPRDFDRIIALLRDGTGELGAMTASTREIGWRAEWFGHRLETSIVPANGTTTIRVRERMRGMRRRRYRRPSRSSAGWSLRQPRSSRMRSCECRRRTGCAISLGCTSIGVTSRPSLSPSAWPRRCCRFRSGARSCVASSVATRRE